MTYVLLLGASILLFIGYIGFTVLEARMGFRILHGTRSHLDHGLSRLAFIRRHVDWIGFTKHFIGSAATRIAHDLIHVTLITVRFAERQLTRIMRVLRNRRPNVLAPKPSRVSPFAQTVAYVRNLLHSSKDRE